MTKEQIQYNAEKIVFPTNGNETIGYAYTKKNGYRQRSIALTKINSK